MYSRTLSGLLLGLYVLQHYCLLLREESYKINSPRISALLPLCMADLTAISYLIEVVLAARAKAAAVLLAEAQG